MKKWVKAWAIGLTLALAAFGAGHITPAQTTAAATFKQFADVSSYQPATSSFFASLKQDGVSGVAVKITEGTFYTNNAPSDPNHAANQISNAKNQGLVVSVYHFAHYKNASQAVAEANFFANQAKRLGLSKSTMMIDDVEDNAMLSGVRNNTVTFQNRLKALGYNNQATYASASWFNGGYLPRNYPIWVASYGTDKPGVDNSSAWQYTSQYQVDGTMIDMSYDFFGTFTSQPAASTSTASKPVSQGPTVSLTATIVNKQSLNESKILNKGASIYYLITGGFSKFTTASGQTATVTQQATAADGSKWDLISKNGSAWGWIKDSDTSDPAAAVSAADTTTTTTTSPVTTADNITSFKGVGTVHYVKGYSIALWSAPSKGHYIGKKLKHGTSWRVYQKAVVNGHTWYNLGGNQWADSKYLIVK